MSPIQIRALCGAAAGRTRRFEQAELTFGRNADNLIVVESPHASRHHGTLLWNGQTWVVENASPNGTTVNNRGIGDRQTPLKSGDVVGVGGEALFDVQIEPAAAEPAAATPEQTQPQSEGSGAAPAPDQAARQKQSFALWFGIIGTLAGVVILLIAVVKPLGDPNGANGSVGGPPELTVEEIRAEITKPLDLPYNEREAEQALKRARREYQRSVTQPDSDALYQAYHHYKKAYAQSNGELFQEGLVYREFKRCEEELVNKVVELYQRGYNQLGANQWKRAERTFRKLTDIYRDTQSRIFKNATDQLRAAQAQSRD